MAAIRPSFRNQAHRLVVLAVVTLVVPSTVLALFGMFRDYSVEPVAFSCGVAVWLVAPYVALVALCGWAIRSRMTGFRTAVELTTAVIVAQSVLLSVVTLNSHQDLAAVGVLFSPVLYLGAALVLTVVGLVRHLAGARTVPLAGTLPQVSPEGRS